MKKVLTACLLLLAMGNAPVFSQRINDLTGINAHPIDPLNLQKRFSWVRVWHDWSNDMAYATSTLCPPPSGDAQCPNVDDPTKWQFQWNPSLNNQTGPKLSYDTYYKNLSMRAIPVLKGIAPQFRGHTAYPNCYTGLLAAMLEQKPFCMNTFWCNDDPDHCGKPGLNLLPTPAQQELPSTYKEHSLWVSLFAAAFGNTPTSMTGLVQSYLKPGEAPFINSNPVIQYLEDNNEPNKCWWDEGVCDDPNTQQNQVGNTYFYFSPKQFAAMLKADLNGDNGTLTASGSPLGIQNFSSGITPVMGGLSGLNGQYLLVLPGQAQGFIPNFHHYSTDLSKLQNSQETFMAGEFADYSTILMNVGGGHGVSPEADSLSGKLRWLGTGIDKNFWLTEFGYDTFGDNGANGSGVEAPNIMGGGDGNYDSQKVQAQWLTRRVLEAASSKRVDKMMLFELSDRDGAAGNGNYSHSGLLSQGKKFKRSWFYIMTLKYLFGEHVYEKANKHNVNGFSIETRPVGGSNWTPADWNKIRVYEFRKGDDDRVFAIWIPTETAIAPFEVRITFPNDINDNNPDYPITGGATLHQIKELSERGRRWNWSSYVNGQTITINNEVLVSETPVFLHINKSYASYPVPPMPVNNNSINCNPQACCGSVELTWIKPTNTLNTLIYYKKKVNGQCPAWDLVSWTLFSNNIGVNKSSATITGLENGEEYCFVIIPIALVGGLAPDNIEGLVPYSGCGAVGSCSSCLINISESELSYDPQWGPLVASDPNYADDYLGLQESANKILDVGQAALACSSINPSGCVFGPPQDGWDEWLGNTPPLTDPNSFYINFTTPKRIKAIYLQDWTGNGDLKIQYESCSCPGYWRNLTTIQLEGIDQCDGTGHYAVKHVSTNVLVKRLRVTKLHSDAVIRRLYFCGSSEACPSNIRQQGSPSDFLADEIRKSSATLRWTAAAYNTLDPETDMVEGYRISLGQQTDAGGNLVNPVHFDIEADANEMELLYRLEGLAPATTYIADLTIEPDPCPQSPTTTPGLRTTFTTESASGGRSAKPTENLKTQTDEPYSVLLRPNPASDEVSVTITAGILESVAMMDTNGRILKQMAASGTSVSINLDGIQPGVYWVRTIRTDKTPLTVLLVKQ